MNGFDINHEEFAEIRRLVYATVGITLNDSKRALVVARLSKRLRHHGLEAFRDYCELLRRSDPDGGEMRKLINCITTNKTEFFREGHHFEWLRSVLVPELKVRANMTGTRRVRIWSAGCSSGQEPYSIAMVLADELGIGTGWDVRILASDIDTNVLAKAEAAQYDEGDVADVPEALQRKYLDRQGTKRVVARAVRDLVTFRRVNLVEPAWAIRARFDAVFCRNVTIYFDQATQEKLYERFVKQLEPNGYLVAGHSENLHWLGRLLAPAGPTIYRPVPKVSQRGSRTSRSFARRSAVHRPSQRPAQRAPSRRPPVPILSQRSPAWVGSQRPPAMAASIPPPAGNDVPIQSGELHASAGAEIVRTILGSCVAACIFDPEARVGGMNHFMLPDGCDTDWVPTRFGTHAMEALIAKVLALGADRSRLRAKIFGGAHVIRSLGANNAIPDDNVAFVREFLATAGILVQSESVGGDLPMMVRFETHTGRAFVRLVNRAESQVVLAEESEYRRMVNDAARDSIRHVRTAKESR